MIGALRKGLDWTLVKYSLPTLCLAIIIGPAGSILQGIYTRELGLKLSDIAVFIVIARILDAFTDPVIGLISDRTRQRFGSRKALMVLGAVVAMAAIYVLFLLPGGMTPTLFFFAYLAMYFGWTLVEIPHLAWGSELRPSYDGRARVFAYRFSFQFAGTMLFLALPILTAAWKSVVNGQSFTTISTDYTVETLKIAFWLLVLLMPLTLFLTLRFTPNGTMIDSHKMPSLRNIAISVRRNPLMLRFALIMFLFYLGNGMQIALAYIHLASYLGLGASAAIIYVICYPLNIIFVPVWLKVATKWGKHRALAAGIGLSAITFVALGLIEPGAGAFWQYLTVFALLQCFQAAWLAAPPAMLGDISDYGTLRSGADQSGAYYALFALIYKSFQGLGAAVGFSVAAWFGFNPALDVHDAESAFGIKMVMAFLPALLGMLTVVLLYKYPLTKARHDIIRRRLARRNPMVGEAA